MNVYKVPHLLFPKKQKKTKTKTQTQNLLLRGDFVFIATNNLKKTSWHISLHIPLISNH